MGAPKVPLKSAWSNLKGRLLDIPGYPCRGKYTKTSCKVNGTKRGRRFVLIAAGILFVLVVPIWMSVCQHDQKRNHNNKEDSPPSEGGVAAAAANGMVVIK